MGNKVVIVENRNEFLKMVKFLINIKYSLFFENLLFFLYRILILVY